MNYTYCTQKQVLLYPKTGHCTQKQDSPFLLYPKTGLEMILLNCVKIKLLRTTTPNTNIARIENNFIFNAQYQLTSREQKILLFLISNINPLDKNFEIQVISLKELKEVLATKRSGSFYEEMMEFSLRISRKQIIFDTDVELEKRKLKTIINWFQSITPIYNEAGDLCIQFKFSSDLKPFLLELKEYTQINYLETIPLKSSYSIRMYQVFRAYRDKMRKHQKRSKLIYDLQGLKKVLGVENKYKDWRKFNERVLQVIEKELNKHTSVQVKVHKQTKGRKVVGVQFEIWDSGSVVSNSSKSGSLKKEALTFAQEKAFKQLVAFGINDGIVLEMLSKTKGSEILGFEDWYFSAVIAIFEAKSNQQNETAKAGTLVIWFLKKKIFEQGDMFAKIMEHLATQKKNLRNNKPDSWDNRQVAKELTATAFRKKMQG